MRVFLLFPYYIRWHYSTALNGIVRITENIVWFTWHFFSVGLNTKTLFSPWQRLQEQRKEGLDIENIVTTIIINILMRCVGAFVRGIFIILGLVIITLDIALGFSLLLIWIALPLTCLFLFVAGIVFLTKP